MGRNWIKRANRRLLPLMMSIVMLLTLLPAGIIIVSADPAFAEGDGTPEHPYQIETAKQLDAVRNDLNAHYVLMSDIDLTAACTVTGDVYGGDFYNGGQGWAPIGSEENPFNGNFDGQGHTITGLSINRPNTANAGLFGVIGNSGTVRMLTLQDADVSAQATVGALAGYNMGSIEQCGVQGSSVKGSGGSLGGLAGFSDGNIRNCYALCTVKGDASSSDKIGGLVGYNTAYWGGTISGCYAAGSLTGRNYIGGLLGYRDGTVTYSYYDREVSGQYDSDTRMGIGLTTLQMLRSANFNGFDFDQVWSIQEGATYPYLKNATPSVLPAPSASITVGSQSGTLKGGQEGTATFAVDMIGAEDGTAMTVSWCDQHGQAVDKPAGLDASCSDLLNNKSTVTVTAAAAAVGGSYYFTISCKGTKSAVIQVAVDTKDYAVSLSQSGKYIFASQGPGYPKAPTLDVTVENMGIHATDDLTVALSGTGTGSFTLSKSTIASIDTGGSDSFTVAPKTGLADGSYTATVTVYGLHDLTASFDVSFTVDELLAAGYTVTYDGNGGSGTAPTESNKLADATFTAAANSFIPPAGRQFKEWNTKPDGSGTAYAAGAAVTMPNGSLILYAVWQSFGISITTFSGEFWNPRGVAVDSSGHIYVADTANCAVKRMDADGSNIITLSSDFLYPNSIAVDSSGYIYVADTANNAVKRMDANGGNILTLSSECDIPCDVKVDGSGHIYVVSTDSSGNGKVYKMDADGSNITELGSGFIGPNGVAVDGSGKIYVADSGNRSLKRMDADGGNIVTLSSEFDYPMCVAVSGGGNIYMTDASLSNTVKRMDADGSNLTILASGFNSPTGIAVDGSGNIYVVDTGNNVIKKIQYAYTIDYNANGGTGTAPAESSKPAGTTFTAAANSFIPPTGKQFKEWNTKPDGSGTAYAAGATVTMPADNLTLYAVWQTLGISITTFGGFDYAGGMAVDSSGHIYVAENTGNGAVKRINTDGSTDTIASGFSWPGSLAADSSGCIYVAENTGSGTVKRINTDGSTDTIASGFNRPCGIAVDGSGNIYVTDYGNSAVKRINAGGGTETIVSGLDRPKGITVDDSGHIYFTQDGDGGAVKRINADGSTDTIASGFNSPHDIAVDSGERIYVTERNGNNVIGMNADGSSRVTIVSSGLDFPEGVAVDGSGNIYVADSGSGSVKKLQFTYGITYNANGGTGTAPSESDKPAGETFAAAVNSFTAPAGKQFKEWNTKPDGSGTAYAESDTIAMPAGNLTLYAIWEAFTAADCTVTYNVNGGTGTPPTESNKSAGATFVAAAANSLIAPKGKLFREWNTKPDGSGTAYAVSARVTMPAGNLTLYAIWKTLDIYIASADGFIVTTFSGFGPARGVAVGSSGRIYMVDAGSNAIRRIDASGNNIATLGSGFKNPRGVAVDGSGRIYVADSGNNAVKRMDADGSNVTTLGSGFNCPVGIAVDGSGNNIYVADSGHSLIKKMNVDGSNITILGSGFDSPGGIALDGSGRIYVADSGNNAVKRMDAGGSNITILGSGIHSPTGVAVDDSGKIYVADGDNGAVYRMDADGNNTVRLGSGFVNPLGVAADSGGNAYVADYGNSTVKKLQPAYAMTYNANGGTGTVPAESDKPAGATFTAAAANSLTPPEGKKFKEWNTKPDGSGTAYAAEATVTMPADRLILYAIWEDAYYTVTYYPNGGTGSAPAESNKAKDATFTAAAANSFTPPAGKKFKEWNTKPDGSGTAYAAEATVTMPAGDLTLYAVWEDMLAISTEDFDEFIITTFSGFNNPGGITADGRGYLYVTDWNENKVYKMRADGSGIVTLGSEFSAPCGIAADGSGHIYVADSGNDAIKRMDADGSNTVILGSGFNCPYDIALDSSGNIYVAEGGSGEIKRMDADGGNIEILASGFNSPTGLAVDGNGNIYVADCDHQIYMIKADGSGTDTFAGGFYSSYSVAVDDGGNVYVADQYNVYKVYADGSDMITLGSGFINPFVVAVDSNGDVYVVDGGKRAVMKIQFVYTITYNANGGSGTAPAESDKLAGATFTAAANSFTPPAGKRFKEWNTAADGSGTSYAAGATVTMPAGNLTLYAIWDNENVYTVTYNANGGSGTAPTESNKLAGATFTAAANSFTPPAGKRFKEWNTAADGSGTSYAAGATVTMPAGNLTLYAIWDNIPDSGGSGGNSGNNSGNSGGNGGGASNVTPPAGTPKPETPKTETTTTGNTVTSTATAAATVDSSGKATAAVTQTQLAEAISKAVAEAAKQGNGATAAVKIRIDAPAGVRTVEASIPKEAMSLAADSKIATLILATPIASISFDAKALSTIAGEAAEAVNITASRVETSLLTSETQQLVGDRPVFNFSVTSGDKTISQFGGNVSVSVPYTPKAGEDANAIVIYYINAEGKAELVSDCIYDPATGTVSFNTNHFSQYAVGYNKVSFKDVAADAWYGKAVGFIAARGITTGTGSGNYRPDAKLTRGEFLVMLMRAYGIKPDTNSKDNFADCGNTYYTGYLAAAKRLGISRGVGSNLFAPDKEITRQEMFTLLYNGLKAIDRLPKGNAGKPLSAFSDAGQVASWAKDAMTMMAGAGAVGGSGGKLSPSASTTRAEMAQVLYNLLQK